MRLIKPIPKKLAILCPTSEIADRLEVILKSFGYEWLTSGDHWDVYKSDTFYCVENKQIYYGNVSVGIGIDGYIYLSFDNFLSEYVAQGKSSADVVRRFIDFTKTQRVLVDVSVPFDGTLHFEMTSSVFKDCPRWLYDFIVKFYSGGTVPRSSLIGVLMDVKYFLEFIEERKTKKVQENKNEEANV